MASPGAGKARGPSSRPLAGSSAASVTGKYALVCGLALIALVSVLQYRLAVGDHAQRALASHSNSRILFPSWDAQEKLARHEAQRDVFAARMPSTTAERAAADGGRDFGVRRGVQAGEAGVGTSGYMFNDEGEEGASLRALELPFEEVYAALNSAGRFSGGGFDFGAVILEPIHSRDFVGKRWKALDRWRDYDTNIRDACKRPHDRACQVYFERQQTPTFLYSTPSGLMGYKEHYMRHKWEGDPREKSLGDSEKPGSLMQPSSSIFNGTAPGREYVSGGDAVEGAILEALHAGGSLEPASWFSEGFRWRIASHGAHTTLHQDVMSNTFVEVVGVKRFHLFPPEMWSDVSMWPEWSSCNRQSMMAFRDRGGAFLRERFGVTNGANESSAADGRSREDSIRDGTTIKPYAIVDLHPGELLLLPANWYHRVECITEEPCQSVSLFWHTSMALSCQQKLGHFFPDIHKFSYKSHCYAREVFNMTVSSPQPEELDSLKSARDACGGRMPEAGVDAEDGCLDALAEWHYFLLSIASKHLQVFPPLVSLHPELEAGRTDLERARLFVGLAYRSRYEAHTMDTLRGLRMPFACDDVPPWCPHARAGRVSSVPVDRRAAMDGEADEIAREAIFNWKWDEIEDHFDLIPVPENATDADEYRLSRILTHFGGVTSLQLSNMLEVYATLALFDDARSTCRFLRCVANEDTDAL